MLAGFQPEFLILAIHTLIFWLVVVILHRFRSRLTLIPLYAFLAALVVYTHTLSSFGVSVIQSNLFFLVSSTAYFTPLLLIVFLLYISDGPKAARRGLEIMIGVSILQFAAVYLSWLEDAEHVFIPATYQHFWNYVWSTIAMVVDIAAMAAIWELSGRVRRLPLAVRVSGMLFAVFVIDTFIFVTAVFGQSEAYGSILYTDILVRGGLSVIMGIVASRYLASTSYSEDSREHPTDMLEIVRFQEDLKEEVATLQSEILRRKEAEEQLREQQELYQLALEGTSAGIWEWDIRTNTCHLSEHFLTLLGYGPEVNLTHEYFVHLIHPEDIEPARPLLFADAARSHSVVCEARLKLKDGSYHWFLISGKAQINDEGEPIRVVGSIIDINDKKIAQSEVYEKLSEVQEENKVMIGRELKMIELKEEIARLKDELAKKHSS